MVPVSESGYINVKGMIWSINELLSGTNYLTRGEFSSGTFVHAFLNTYDYHRQHALVSGKILVAMTPPGQCYLQVERDPNPPGGGAPRLRPVRPIPPPRNYNELNGLEAEGTTGYQFLQSRGVIIIDNPTLGLVVLPVGMAQVSSVNTKLRCGQHINKGDEISWFELGGSDIIMLFQEKARLD